MSKKITPVIRKLIYKSENPDDIKLGFELLKTTGISVGGFYYHLNKAWVEHYSFDCDNNECSLAIGAYDGPRYNFKYKIHYDR